MEEPDADFTSDVPQLVVSLRREAFVVATKALPNVLEGRIAADDSASLAVWVEREAAFQPNDVFEGDKGFGIVTSIERDGLVLDVQPLSLPVGDGQERAFQVPMGEGRTVVASAEAFSLRGGRPSDAILSGTLLMTFGDRQRMEAAFNRLSDAPRVVASVERVPARRLIRGQAGAVGGAWHLQRIRADVARQAAGYDDARGVTVAVVDSGVDAAHPALSPGMAGYTYSYPGVPAPTARDLLAHGTNVSGVIGARGTVDGVSAARLRVFKAFRDEVDRYQPLRRDDGRWFFAAESAPSERLYVAALAKCLDEDVPVINLSLGYENPYSREAALFTAFARQGQAVVAAVGNGGQGGPLLFPARYPDAIAVGALGRDDRVAAFSTPAPFTLLSAPGIDILGTMPTYPGSTEFEGHVDAAGVLQQGAPIPWQRDAATMSGTSSSAPQVSAAAALWIARHGRNLGGLRAALAATARKLPEMGGADRTDAHGHGCLDLAALLA